MRDGCFLQQNVTCFGLSNVTCKGKRELSFFKGFISEDPDFCGDLLQSTELLQTIKNSVELFLWLFIGSIGVLAANKADIIYIK